MVGSLVVVYSLIDQDRKRDAQKNENAPIKKQKYSHCQESRAK